MITRELESVRKEYTELKLYSDQKSASDANLLEEKGKKLEELQEQLESALTKVDKNEELIGELTYERDGLRKRLDLEGGKVKLLEEELRVVQRTLHETRNEAAELAGRLEISRSKCKDLEGEVSRVQTEYSEAKEGLQKNINRLKQTVEMLAEELASSKELSERTKEELKRFSVELSEASETRDILNKELKRVSIVLVETSTDVKLLQNMLHLPHLCRSIQIRNIHHRSHRVSHHLLMCFESLIGHEIDEGT